MSRIVMIPLSLPVAIIPLAVLAMHVIELSFNCSIITVSFSKMLIKASVPSNEPLKMNN